MIYLENFYVWVGFEPMTWVALFILSSLIDALITIYALNRGGYEGNFVIRFLMRYVPAPVALFSTKGLQAGIILGSLQVNVAVLPLLTITYVVVCIWNIWQVSKLKIDK